MIDIWKNWPSETMDVRFQAYMKNLAEGVETQQELMFAALERFRHCWEMIGTGYYDDRDMALANSLEKWLRAQLALPTAAGKE